MASKEVHIADARVRRLIVSNMITKPHYHFLTGMDSRPKIDGDLSYFTRIDMMYLCKSRVCLTEPAFDSDKETLLQS